MHFHFFFSYVCWLCLIFSIFYLFFELFHFFWFGIWAEIRISWFAGIFCLFDNSTFLNLEIHKYFVCRIFGRLVCLKCIVEQNKFKESLDYQGEEQSKAHNVEISLSPEHSHLLLNFQLQCPHPVLQIYFWEFINRYLKLRERASIM